MRRLLVLTLLLAPCALADEARAPARAEVAPAPHRARLAAWRAGARPPEEVPATVVVKAARGERAAAGPGRGAGARRGSAKPSVEIIWHAPGWNE